MTRAGQLEDGWVASRTPWCFPLPGPAFHAMPGAARRLDAVSAMARKVTLASSYAPT